MVYLRIKKKQLSKKKKKKNMMTMMIMMQGTKDENFCLEKKAEDKKDKTIRSICQSIHQSLFEKLQLLNVRIVTVIFYHMK